MAENIIFIGCVMCGPKLHAARTLDTPRMGITWLLTHHGMGHSINIAAIRERMSHLLKGCKCVTRVHHQTLQLPQEREPVFRRMHSVKTVAISVFPSQVEQVDELQLVAVSEIHDELEVDDMMDMLFGDHDFEDEHEDFQDLRL